MPALGGLPGPALREICKTKPIPQGKEFRRNRMKINELHRGTALSKGHGDARPPGVIGFVSYRGQRGLVSPATFVVQRNDCVPSNDNQ